MAQDQQAPAVARILEEQVAEALRNGGLTPDVLAGAFETLSRGVRNIGSFVLAGLEEVAQAARDKAIAEGRRVDY
jgi:hypothetical protein